MDYIFRVLIFLSVFWVHGLIFQTASFAQTLSENESVRTEAQNPLMSPDEQKIAQKARKRFYPGGRDEESLKVQAQLPAVTRKMAPTTEAPVEESAASPSDD